VKKSAREFQFVESREPATLPTTRRNREIIPLVAYLLRSWLTFRALKKETPDPDEQSRATLKRRKTFLRLGDGLALAVAWR